MPDECKVRLTFVNAADQATFNQLRTDPALQPFIDSNIESAVLTFMPRLHAGVWGLTAAEIDRAIAVLVAQSDWANSVRPKEHRLHGDERLISNLVFEAACRTARNEFLAALREQEPVARALIALAGLGAAVVEGVAALQAAAAPHALAARPTQPHRRLRPEDFGALPSRPRS